VLTGCELRADTEVPLVGEGQHEVRFSAVVMVLS
jgi:hypothetical protein